MSIIDGVKLPNGNTYNITLPLLSSGFTTTAGSSTSGAYLAAKWAVANVNGITTPVDGMTIAVRVPLAGNSGGILLSINGGTTYYPIVRNVNTLVTTQYAVGSTLVLTFNSTQTASPYTSSGVASTVTGCWQIADYDANTKNSAGTSNKTGTKMYIVGGTSQNSNGVTTYSNTNCYIGTDNALYSGGKKVATVNDIPAAPTLSSLGGVPTSRTINGKALSSNISLTASDVGASASNHKHSVTDITTGGTLGVRVNANANAMATLANLTLRNIYAKTTDMTAGSTELATGAICLIYE